MPQCGFWPAMVAIRTRISGLTRGRPRARPDRQRQNRRQRLQLGIAVSARSIRRYRRRGPARPPSQNWRTFLTNHAQAIWAADLFVVQTLDFPDPLRPLPDQPRPPPLAPLQRDRSPDRHLDLASDDRDHPVGPAPEVPDPPPRSHLQCRLRHLARSAWRRERPDSCAIASRQPGSTPPVARSGDSDDSDQVASPDSSLRF